MHLKILTYNIHKGFDWKNRNYFLKEMKAFIESTQADIVFLQEVVGKNTKWEGKGKIDDQFEFLADTLWPHSSYGKNAAYDHGHHGNVILSKFPIKSSENIDLSTNKREKRGLLLCKILLPESDEHDEKLLYAASSHLNLLNGGRILQYQKIRDHLSTKEISPTAPLIIAGDFNDWNRKSSKIFEGELGMTETYKALHGNYAKTFPAARPLLPLDRIYVKNLTLKTASVPKPKLVGRLFSHLSDHRPLFCEMEINCLKL